MTLTIAQFSPLIAEGAAKALMAHPENAARADGLSRILLESGSKLAEAVTPYDALGYPRRAPFADCKQGEATVFLDKEL